MRYEDFFIKSVEIYQRRARCRFRLSNCRRLDSDSLLQPHGKTLLLHRHAFYRSAGDLSDSRFRMGFRRAERLINLKILGGGGD